MRAKKVWKKICWECGHLSKAADEQESKHISSENKIALLDDFGTSHIHADVSGKGYYVVAVKQCIVNSATKSA